MSDTSILPTAADTGVVPPAGRGQDFGEEPDDRRRLMVIGGAVAAVLVIVVGYLLLHGGGSPSEVGAVPQGTPQVVTSPTTGGDAAGGSTTDGKSGSGKSANGGSKAGTALPKSSGRRLAKDPFKPLVVNNESGGATGTATGPTTTVDGTTSGDGTVPTSSTDGGAPSKAAGAPVAIRLVRITGGGSSAVFDVTYSHHQVFRFEVTAPDAKSTRGTVFAQDFSLLGIQGNEVTIQVGDDTPLDLRRGVTHTV